MWSWEVKGLFNYKEKKPSLREDFLDKVFGVCLFNKSVDFVMEVVFAQVSDFFANDITIFIENYGWNGSDSQFDS